MKDIGVHFNPQKPVAAEVADRAIRVLKNSGARAIFGSQLEQTLEKGDLEALLAVGGDGTILHCAVRAAKSGVPVLGINVGRIGFLSGAQQDELDASVRRMLSKDYALDERTLLNITADSENMLALNELLVYRPVSLPVLHLVVFVDGMKAVQWACDGLVIATTTGSTAYSLSAGGPIVAPGSDVLLITPVCAHSLSARPIIIPACACVKVEIEEASGMLFTDGKLWRDSLRSRMCEVVSSELRARFIRFKTHNFFELLHKKLK